MHQEALRDSIYGQSIVIVSPQPWSDMWVSKHAISWELSKQNRVLFVNPSYSPMRFLLEPSNTKLRKIIFPRLHRIKNQLIMFTPWIIPGSRYNKKILIFNEKLIVRQLRQILCRLRFKNPILFIFDGKFPFLIGKLGEKMSIYYCVDMFFYDNPLHQDYEHITAQKVDLILAISDFHAKRLGVFGKPVFTVPHGYFPEFSQPFVNTKKKSDPKIIGMVGQLSARVDTRLIIHIAESFPEYKVVLVGPTQNLCWTKLTDDDLKNLNNMSNIYLVGPQPFRELPKYISQFDVCIVPLKTSLKQVQQSNPYKLLQYLALGKPVVSTAFKSARNLDGLIYVADNEEQFIAYVKQALNEKGDRLKMARMKYAEEYTYDKIITKIANHIRVVEDHRKNELVGNT